MEGRVIAVNISDQKGISKRPIEEGFFMIDHGLKGDAHAGNWHRQVSLLDTESINRMKALGVANLEPGSFAENITTEGLKLWELPVGTKLQIGETLQEVTQIGKECHTKCAIYQQAGICAMPTEGIFTKVLKEGTIKAGDQILVL